MEFDPKYEYDAPQYFDFTKNVVEDDGVDHYFDTLHIGSGDKSRTKLNQPSNKASKQRTGNSTKGTTIRKSERLKAARDAAAGSSSNIESGEVATKRRRLNAPASVQNVGSTSNVSLDADELNNNRVTKSSVETVATTMTCLSRSMSQNAATSTRGLPSSIVSRGSLKSHLRLRSTNSTPSSSPNVSQNSIESSTCSYNETMLGTAGGRKVRLTLAKTPNVLKRTKSKSSVYKTTEQLELEKISEMKNEVEKQRKLNDKSYRAAISGCQPLKRESQPVTKVKEFQFETDSRLNKKQSHLNTNTKSVVGGELDFAAILRKTDVPAKPVPLQTTKAKPFNFILGKKRKHTEDGAAASTGYKFEALAEKLWKFSSKTPERLRAKNAGLLPPIVKSSSNHLTVAKTPNLITKTRSRKVHVLSQAEREEIEVQEMKKHQFQAMPPNEKVLAQQGLGVKPVRSRAVTVPEPFKLSAGNHKETTDANETTQQTVFHANPLPTSILQGVVGLKPAKKIPSTVAQSPAFCRRRSARVVTKPPQRQCSPRATFYHPVPQFSNPFKPKLQHECTQPQPFSFEEQTIEMFQHREDRIKEVLLKEKEARKFSANPMPDLSAVKLPEKARIAGTVAAPFEFVVDARGEEKAHKLREKIALEEKERKELAEFKARPPAVLNQLPFEPQRHHKSAVDVKPFRLSTEMRAGERAQWEQWRAAQDRALELEQSERESLRVQDENAETQRLRAETVHHANPIRHFKPAPPRQALPLTEPISPQLVTRLRSRVQSK